MSLVGKVIMNFKHAIARVLKGMDIWAGEGATFGAGVTALFVASLPNVGSRVPVRYHCGGWPEEVNTCLLNSYMVYL